MQDVPSLRVQSSESPTPSSFNVIQWLRVLMGEAGDPSDAELVRRVREGEEEAFGTLVDRYARAAYSVALSVTGTHHDAEDAAQEAFVAALERMEDCRDPERFGGWFLTIVRNRSRNLRRRESVRDGEELPESLPTVLRAPDRSAESAELRGELRRALAQLTQLQREIVLLHDLQGWKHKEIAERLEMPSGTVRSHLHHARKALRERLAAYEPRVLHRPLRREAAS